MRSGRFYNVTIARWVLPATLMLITYACMAAASEQLPVVLIYGFQPVPGFRATQIWEAFAEHFSGNDVSHAEAVQADDGHEFFVLKAVDPEHRDVILSNPASPLEPTVRDIFYYVRRFAAELAALSSQRSMSRFDVIAHSMGGLIGRAYVERGDFGGDAGFVGEGEIATLVMLATPNHGSEVAALGEWFTTLGGQMAPTSEFLRTLNALQWVENEVTSINPAVRYVSLAGQTCLGCGLSSDQVACRRACVEEGLAWDGFDFVVTMSSAYLPGAENCALIGYDHVSLRDDPAVANVIACILDGAHAPSAVYADGYEPHQRP